MRTLAILCALPLLLVSCDREEPASRADAKSKTPNRISTLQPGHSLPPGKALGVLASRSGDPRRAEFSERIYRLLDEELDLAVEAILACEEPDRRRDLFSALYEETLVRPPSSRLPLLLEIARQPDTEPSLRTTIMAELGATLQAEHGTSWADWMLAMEEFLAENEGLIRVK